MTDREPEPPKLFGVAMTSLAPGILAECWQATFGSLSVVLGRYEEGRFSPKLGAWNIDVGDSEERFVSRAEALAALERALSTIRAAIPDPKPAGGPRHCRAHGGYGFTSDCVTCAANASIRLGEVKI